MISFAESGRKRNRRGKMKLEKAWYGPVESASDCQAEGRKFEVFLKSEKKPSTVCQDVSRSIKLLIH